MTSVALALGYWAGGRTGLIVALMLAAGPDVAAYFFSGRLALRAMRARPRCRASSPWSPSWLPQRVSPCRACR
ncbi:hypothetical protein [Nonomuraea polychroma]|uniref:hypothetical protein n=1 Tax=Nonomuraea polychroma TaxID=46176 RepID=UPI001F4EBF64|nr:hypothetical protein [Nonomuraea polychroma]